MTPLSLAHTELRLAVERAELRAAGYLSEHPRDLEPAAHDPAALDEHRLDVAGDLCDALDRVERGLGKRLMQALYPEVDLQHDSNLAALHQLLQFLRPDEPHHPGATQ